MAVQDIAFVELYVRDGISAVDHLVSAMGFTRVASSVEDDLDSVLLRQGDVQLVVTSGRGTWSFLDQHGDGIADIAFRCDDVISTEVAAVAAGATPLPPVRGNTVVPGFGDVTHTLLPLTGRPTGAARRQWSVPADPEWHADQEWRAEPTDQIRLLDHVAVCVPGGTLDEYADFYRDSFGFSRYSSEYVAVGGQAMDSIAIRSVSERVTFTLVAPDPEKEHGQLDAFLDRNGGPGVQHLAFRVDEIVPAVRECRDRGVRFLTVPDAYYEMLHDRIPDLQEEIDELRETQVLVDRDEWGHLLQLFSRSPYERDTLFYELIQRRGARGFGKSNIRALYEAVERDRLNAE